VHIALAVAVSRLLGCSGYSMPVGRRAPPACSTICALGVPGVRVAVRDTPDGVDLTFVVVGDEGELRKRLVAAFAGEYPMRAEGRAIARRVHATIRDEERGLVVHAVPIDPAERASVQAAFHKAIEDLQSRDCD
jgi:hypothetical protein